MLALFAVMALLSPPPAPEPETGVGTVLVYTADGNTVALQSWSFQYEYVAWPKKATPEFAAPGHRQVASLWDGKRGLPVAGANVTVSYPAAPPTANGAPGPRRATGLVLEQGGVRTEIRALPPERVFLAPNADKQVNVIARSLDLRGQTLTGSDRGFCLLSFSATVDCGGTPADQVVKLEFTAAAP